MSMYNMINGYNPSVQLALVLLEINPKDISRFRDAYIDIKNEQIVIFTRTGGSKDPETYDNRACFPNDILENHKLFISTKDDDFDPTYAYYYFKIPEDKKIEVLKIMKDKGIKTEETIDLKKQVEDFVKRMEK